MLGPASRVDFIKLVGSLAGVDRLRETDPKGSAVGEESRLSLGTSPIAVKSIWNFSHSLSSLFKSQPVVLVTTVRGFATRFPQPQKQ